MHVVKPLRCLTYVLILAFVYASIHATIFAVDCVEASGASDLSINSSCVFSGTVNGVDNGQLAISPNTASLTVNTGATLTIIPGQTIVAGVIYMRGGVIAIFKGSKTLPGGKIFMNDSDHDGYPSDTNRYAVMKSPPVSPIISPTPLPTGYTRKSQMYESTISDRDDTIPCPDFAYNPVFTPPICNMCYHGAPDPLPKNVVDNRCTEGNICDGQGACYPMIKRVFISSTTYTGILGGVNGADEKCRTLAANASLGGTWKAWISSSTENAASRLFHSNTPYTLVDGITVIADNWNALVSGSLQNGIMSDEYMRPVKSGTKVWTNTTGNGLSFSSTLDDTCQDWTSTTNRSRYGLNERFGGDGWTNSNYTKCENPLNLYCFEQ